jgi:hypothetical protein
MIDPAKVAFWVPPELKNFKRKLFDRIGAGIKAQGGTVLYDDFTQLGRLSDKMIPIVGCSPYLKPLVQEWRATKRTFIYWDRGFVRRVFATDLPTGINGGYYRWCVNSFAMNRIKPVNDLRWKLMSTPVWDWSRDGKHIVIAEPSATYEKFHGIEGWTERTVAALKQYTSRPLVFRDKEMQRSGRKLHEDLKGAHCLVTHGSNAAVEAVIMGCPVLVHSDSAASLVGLTDISKIEEPIYPDRQPWLNSLAHCQYTENEMCNGKLWRTLE